MERGLRRSKRVEERQQAEEENDSEEVEEVLISSQQATTTPPLESTSSQQPSLQSSIIIDQTEHRDIIIRSRAHTPIVGATSPISFISTGSPIQTVQSQSRRTSQSSSRRTTQEIDASVAPSDIANTLLKQGKQIRALYEMQKKTLKKIESIDKKMKKLVQKTNDLSPKVFNVSNNLVYNNIVYYRYLTL